VSLCINAQSGFADAFKACDDAFVVRTIFQEYAQNTLLVVLDELIVTNKSFAFEDVGDFSFNFGTREFQLFMANHVSVANTSQHICNWISHNHYSLPPSRIGDYQLAFLTPGIRPLWASSRKQTRHNLNLRMTEFGRPQR